MARFLGQKFGVVPWTSIYLCRFTSYTSAPSRNCRNLLNPNFGIYYLLQFLKPKSVQFQTRYLIRVVLRWSCHGSSLLQARLPCLVLCLVNDLPYQLFGQWSDLAKTASFMGLEPEDLRLSSWLPFLSTGQQLLRLLLYITHYVLFHKVSKNQFYQKTRVNILDDDIYRQGENCTVIVKWVNLLWNTLTTVAFSLGSSWLGNNWIIFAPNITQRQKINFIIFAWFYGSQKISPKKNQIQKANLSTLVRTLKGSIHEEEFFSW